MTALHRVTRTTIKHSSQVQEAVVRRGVVRHPVRSGEGRIGTTTSVATSSSSTVASAPGHNNTCFGLVQRTPATTTVTTAASVRTSSTRSGGVPVLRSCYREQLQTLQQQQQRANIINCTLVGVATRSILDTLWGNPSIVGHSMHYYTLDNTNQQQHFMNDYLDQEEDNNSNVDRIDQDNNQKDEIQSSFTRLKSLLAVDLGEVDDDGG